MHQVKLGTVMILFTLICISLSCKTSKIETIDCDDHFAFRSNYAIQDDKEFLSNMISKANENGDLGAAPMLVVDAIPFLKCHEGKLDYIPIYRADIIEVSVLDGKKAIALYGEQASDGVLLVTTKHYQEKKKEKRLPPPPPEPKNQGNALGNLYGLLK